jgi:hypothetical protein
MRNGAALGSVITALRSLAKRITEIAQWSFDASEEDLPQAPPPAPGPPHGPIPAIDLRRDPHRGEVPPASRPGPSP